MEKTLARVKINPDNPEPRQALVLLLDVSHSMNDGQQITAVNDGLVALGRDLNRPPASRRVEVAVVTFNEQVTLVQDFTEIARFLPPRLTASGATAMQPAILTVLQMVEERKALYRANGLEYYRPWIFMVTDGQPNDPNVDHVALKVRRAEDERKIAFFAVGTAKADFSVLKAISHETRPPMCLKHGQWVEMFRWLSSSMATLSRSQPDAEEAPTPPLGWGTFPK